MIYDKELKGYKQTNFQHPKGLITFPSRTAMNCQESTLDRMFQQIGYFTNTIHGASYIWEKGFRFKVRLFWFLVVTVAIISCITMYMSLSYHHTKQQIKTIVETSQMPIYTIYFPSVALCPWIHVNWLRYKAAEEKFLPSSADTNTKLIFYKILRILDDIELLKLDSLELLQNHTIARVIDKIPLNDLAAFVAFRCDELFGECVYDETKYDCCKIFVPERTEKGICMVFNSMISEDSRKKQINDKFYPWKNRKAGEGSGLQFTIRYNQTFANKETQAVFGIDVMIKHCEEWSESFTNLFLPNTKSYLAITPIISETSTSTRYLEPRKRGCLFADEISNSYDRIEGLTFNKINCVVKCQQKKFIEICNCSLSWFFPKIDTRDCTVSDFKCIYENKDVFTYIKSPLQDKYIKDSRRGVVCDCVSSCYSLVYLTGLNSNNVAIPNASFPIIQGDIFIGQTVLTKYQTHEYSTILDLIAQFGGILGLCLGASILSLAEVLYASLKIVFFLCVTKRSQKLRPKGKLDKK